MTHLITFEVIAKGNPIGEALRNEIETKLKDGGWRHTAVHTTFVSTWAMDSASVMAKLKELINASRRAAKALPTESMVALVLLSSNGAVSEDRL